MDIDGALEKTYRDHINLFISIGRYKFSLDQATAMDRLQEAFVKTWSNRMRICSQALNGQQGDVIVLGCRADVAEKRRLDLFDEFGYCGGGGPDAIAG